MYLDHWLMENNRPQKKGKMRRICEQLEGTPVESHMSHYQGKEHSNLIQQAKYHSRITLKGFMGRNAMWNRTYFMLL